MSHVFSRVRRGMRRVWPSLAVFGLAVAVWSPLIPVGEALAKPTVNKARQWAHPTYTRFVLELSEPFDYEIFTLRAPDRMVIDLPEVVIARAAMPRQGRKPVGLIAGYRVGQYAPGVSRVVIDLTGPAAIQDDFILPPSDGKPYRFVLDLVAAARAEFDRSARSPETDRRSAAVPPKREAVPPRPPVARYTVVIDAGHGGVDPGAIGPSGIHEKQVTLTAARELAALLRESGAYNVVMTRERDEFLPLRERVARARRVGADLFLSLHADSIERSQLRGAHVYSLSETASDAEAAALAAKENKADLIGGVDLTGYTDDVGNILLDLAQRETNNISAEFANTLVSTFRGQGLAVLRKAHRQAGFAVLKAPDVPSVLIELGFLSNRHDENMLKTPAKRKELLRGVAQAVDRHFATTRIGQRE